MTDIKRTAPPSAGQRPDEPVLAAGAGGLAAFREEWKTLLSEFLNQAQESSARLFKIIGPGPLQDRLATRAEQKSAMEAMAPALAAFRSSDSAFRKSAAFKGSMFRSFAMSEVEQLRNCAVVAIGLRSMIETNFEARRSDIEMAARSFRAIVDPFQVLEKVYLFHPYVQRWLDLTLAGVPASAPAADARIRALVSDILETASAPASPDEARAVIRAEWSPAVGALTFMDRTPRFEAFAEFAKGRPGRDRIEALALRAEERVRVTVQERGPHAPGGKGVEAVKVLFSGPGEGARSYPSPATNGLVAAPLPVIGASTLFPMIR